MRFVRKRISNTSYVFVISNITGRNLTNHVRVEYYNISVVNSLSLHYKQIRYWATQKSYNTCIVQLFTTLFFFFFFVIDNNNWAERWFNLTDATVSDLWTLRAPTRSFPINRMYVSISKHLVTIRSYKTKIYSFLNTHLIQNIGMTKKVNDKNTMEHIINKTKNTCLNYYYYYILYKFHLSDA